MKRRIPPSILLQLNCRCPKCGRRWIELGDAPNKELRGKIVDVVKLCPVCKEKEDK